MNSLQISEIGYVVTVKLLYVLRTALCFKYEILCEFTNYLLERDIKA